MTMPSETQVDETAPPVEADQASSLDDPHGTFLRTKNFSALNGIRCLCCLAVIKEHVEWQIPNPRLMTFGWLGVDLFFVISGFLIVTLLIRERERRGSVNLGKFYARRTLRIFPIYYLMILSVFGFYLAISPWRPNGLRYYFTTFLVLLVYLQDVIRVPIGNFFHCWSLAMEEQFYLCWPTVERFAGRTMRWVILGGMLILNQAVNFGLFDGLITRIYGDPAAVLLPIVMITFTPILLGVSLAYLLQSRRSFDVLYRLIGYKWSPFLFLAILLAICEVAPDVGRGWARLLIHLNFMLMLGSMVIREDHFARPILTFPPFARIGVISYGVYLYHVWIIQVIDVVQKRLHLGPMNKPLLFVVVMIATVITAELSFRFIEQPLLRVKERFHS